MVTPPSPMAQTPKIAVRDLRTWYGPMHKAFAALDESSGAALARDLTELLDELNVGGPSSLVVPGEYLEAVIVRR